MPPSPVVDRLRALAALPPQLRAWARPSLGRLDAGGGRPQRARAYCGEAHQAEWRLPGWPPAELVELPTGAAPLRYRLVRDPVTGVPAHDRRGALVYVPARPGVVDSS